MRRGTRIAAWSAAVVTVLVAAPAGAIYLFATSDFVRGQIEQRAAAYSGRKTTIGSITVDWGSVTHLNLKDVQIANADWGKADHMFKAAEVDLDIRLWPLLRGDFVLPHLRLLRPELKLERNQQDQSNWSFQQRPGVATAVKAVKPQERHQTPLVGRLEVEDGKVGFSDLKRGIDLDGTISTAVGHAGAQPQAHLSLKGHLQKQPLTVRFAGGSALMLRQTDQPYPVDLAIDYGPTKLALKGTLQDPLQWKGADVELSLSGQSLSDIYPLLGIPGPRTPPYHLSGRLEREPGIWKVTKTAWHAGNSDLSGDIVIDERNKPGHLSANLMAQRLDFADLAPLIGASPSGHETEQQLEARGELFPSEPMHVERLRVMNMDVSLDARHVVAASYLPVNALSFHVHVQDGVATVQPLMLAVAGGTVTGHFSVDARSDIPDVRAALVLRGLEFGRFFRGTRYANTTHGKLQGRLALQGRGRSLAEVMAAANGHVEFAMAAGSVSDLMVSLAGLQIADALILYIAGDHSIPIDCALGRFDLKQGVATFDHTLLDTRKSILHVDGQVSFASQSVQARVTADAKKFDLLDLHGPVIVSGKLRQPTVSLGRVFPLPTPTVGTAKDVPCEAMTQQLFSSQ
ncbi:MAG TPA: AsmA family protein [Reyranella sp.]|jgi:uncharacterized protein involved in outer membrane biogenesis|nr:AsmA family protein [Reyranella sp.]